MFWKYLKQFGQPWQLFLHLNCLTFIIIIIIISLWKSTSLYKDKPFPLAVCRFSADGWMSINLLAVKPTHRAYGITSRSQLLDANKMMAVVMQMHPTKMHINASSHSGCNSGVKHWYGRLYSVIHVHIRPNRVSPANNRKIEREKEITTIAQINYWMNISIWTSTHQMNEIDESVKEVHVTSNIGDNPIGCSQTNNCKYISCHKKWCTDRCQSIHIELCDWFYCPCFFFR